MLKRTGVLGAILLSFSTASSASCEFYAGLGIGPESADYKQKGLVVRNSPFAPISNFNVIDKTHLSGKGWSGSLFAGYAMRFASCNRDCEDLYLALEANITARKVKFKSSNSEFLHSSFGHTSYKMERDYGVSLLPGYAISDCTLFYARVGYARGQFKIATTDISLLSIHKDLNGFRYGLGIRQDINECFAVRMDYSHTHYKRASMFTYDPVGFTSKSTSIKPTTHRLEIAALYTF
jgi:outer membrane immunogenic protein